MMAFIPPSPPHPPVDRSPDLLLTNSMDYGLTTTLYDLNLFYKKAITIIKHVPQTGPNCGLAALAMAATLTPYSTSLNDIFHEANKRGFTNNGEMFSVKNMATLAETILTPWFQVEMFSGGLANKKSLVVERLYAGALMLIPYDADKDHGPCCKGGHKAHWALVCGVMVSAGGQECVAARHGKSRYLAIWSLDELALSNSNLSELDPTRARDGRVYLVPPGGLSAGLASKFILLHRAS